MNPLEVQVKTQAGLYTVTYGLIKAPLDVQEAAFAAYGLKIVSPAELGSLRANQPEGATTFNSHSRTSAEVFYDKRSDKVVIVPDGAISKQVGIANLVKAHRQTKEYVIPEDQRKVVYAMVDAMLESDIAFIVPYRRITVKTSEFGQIDLTDRLFTDERLGIEAQEYGDWLRSQGKETQSIVFDDRDHSRSQKGPYVNRLRVTGTDSDFHVSGGGGFPDLELYNGAFGVRFEKAAEKSVRKKDRKPLNKFAGILPAIL